MISSRLFSFVEDWLFAEVCHEQAIEASYGCADAAQFYELLTEMARIQCHRKHFSQALYFSRQALGVSEYIIGTSEQRVPLYEIISASAANLERSGTSLDVLPKLQNTKGDQVSLSSVAHEFAMRQAMSENSLASDFFTTLFHEIDLAIRGPGPKEGIDLEKLRKKCDLAVTFAGGLNDPSARLAALEQQLMVKLLAGDDGFEDAFAEIEKLRGILGRGGKS
jgi:hypothetical protein